MAEINIISSRAATPQAKHRFSSDHRSYVLSGWGSTSLGDRLRIPGAVRSFCDVIERAKCKTKFPFLQLTTLRHAKRTPVSIFAKNLPGSR